MQRQREPGVPAIGPDAAVKAAVAKPEPSSGAKWSTTRSRAARHRGATVPLIMLGCVLAAGLTPTAQGQTFTVLYSFAGYPSDGAGPLAGLFMAPDGTLYGTTTHGGSVNSVDCANAGLMGCGTVFKLDNGGKETVLHNFDQADGANPYGGVILDAQGNLYGTTAFGGRLEDCTGNGSTGCGVVFELTGEKEMVLHRFCSVSNCNDGAVPWSGLVMDPAGALYGTASGGGANGYGVVFKLVGPKQSVVHPFEGTDGAYPEASLLLDGDGTPMEPPLTAEPSAHTATAAPTPLPAEWYSRSSATKKLFCTISRACRTATLLIRA